MDQETAKAINNISKRLNAVEHKLDAYFLQKHLENSNSIVDTDTAVMELGELVSELLGVTDTDDTTVTTEEEEETTNG